MRGLSAGRYIDAPPEHVWELISDVTRTGEWSPICRKCEWVGEVQGPEVGARFRGHNREGPLRWSRDCVVTVSEPGRAFGFTTMVQGRESTHWVYELEPEGAGTRVKESYEPVFAPRYVRLASALLGPRLERNARRNIETSLDRLKAVAERSNERRT